jgi:hypothetical protein
MFGKSLLKMAVMKAAFIENEDIQNMIVDHDNGLNDECSYSLPHKIIAVSR